MQLCETSSDQQELDNGKSKEELRFDESLHELKDLRAQLHYAADYCETTYLKSNDKREIVDNTKEYICRAVVTLVDHLGNVSANLDHFVSSPNQFSDAGLRIDCLKQRILCLQQYAQKLALSRLRWRENFPTHHRRYLSTVSKDVQGSSQDSRDSGSTKIIDKKYIESEKVPQYTSIDEPSLSFRNPSMKGMAVLGGLSLIPSKDPNSTFHFQLVSSKLRRSGSLNRKSSSPALRASDILTFMRRLKKSNAKK